MENIKYAEYNEYHNKCVLCGSLSYKKIFEEGNYSYGICKECSHVYQLDRGTAKHYASLPYESDWDNYLEHSSDRASYIYSFCSEHIKAGSIKDILDIGCGPGGVLANLSYMYRAGNAIGITVPEDLKNKFYPNISLLDIRYTGYDKPTEGKFDLVVMSHVLEHFLDPFQALINARSNMKSNGLLYIEVPSFDWVEMRSNPMFCPVHISYFSKNKLLDILHFLGFEIIKVKESKYWGNIKVLVKIKKDRWSSWKSTLQELFYLARLYNNNWRIKLLSWKFKKKFLYWIFKAIKKHKQIKPND